VAHSIAGVQRLLTAQGGGEDVCYFVVRRYGAERVRSPHAERRIARKGSNSIACSPPIVSTVRGEDRCYFDS